MAQRLLLRLGTTILAREAMKIKSFGLLGFFYFGLDGGFHMPRLTHTNADYVVMPLLGYLLCLALPWIDHLLITPIRKAVTSDQ